MSTRLTRAQDCACHEMSPAAHLATGRVLAPAAAAACCLHAHLSREPCDGAAGTQIAGALGVSLWQRQATVLWDPKGDVPGDVRCHVRHFAWLRPPPFRLLLWAEVCYPGNAPLARRCGCMLPTRTSQLGALGRSRWRTDCRSLGSEPLAMPGRLRHRRVQPWHWHLHLCGL